VQSHDLALERPAEGGQIEAVSTAEAPGSPNPVSLFAGVNDGGKSGLPPLPRRASSALVHVRHMGGEERWGCFFRS